MSRPRWPYAVVWVIMVVLGVFFVTADPPELTETNHIRDESGGMTPYVFSHDGSPTPAPGPSPQEHFEYRGGRYSFIPSPNFSERSQPVMALVIHVTAGGECESIARNHFGRESSKVSAHFIVCKDGAIVQTVDTNYAAWHAGKVNKPDLSNPLIAWMIDNGINPNDPTIGIEVTLATNEKLGDFPDMLWSVDELVLWATYTWDIPADRVHITGHYQYDSVDRAVDPICCINLDGTAALAAWRLDALRNPPIPPPLTLEERVRRIEDYLGLP